MSGAASVNRRSNLWGHPYDEIPLHSSVLAGFRLYVGRQQLWLRFRAGDLYVYQMVPATVIQALIEAPSKGGTSTRQFAGAFHVAAYLSAYGPEPCPTKDVQL